MTGVLAQFAYKKETTPDTYETPDAFLEFVQEGVTTDIKRIESKGLRAGRAISFGWAAGNIDHDGGINLELVPESTAGLLELCMGTLSGPTGAGPYVYTFTRTATTALPKFSTNFGIPNRDSTVRSKSQTGAMVKSFTLSGDASGDGEMIQFVLDTVCREVTLDETVPSATYPTFNRWTTVQASLTLAGSAFCVDSWTLKGEHNIDVNHQECAADAGLAKITDLLTSTFTGTLVADFTDNYTAYNRYVSGTEAALVITISDGTYSLVITSNIRTDGTTPTVSGPGLVKQELPFMCTSGTSDAAAITMVLTSPDATI